MPFHMDHAVLIKGHEWKEKKVTEEPVAIRAYYHDPYGNQNVDISANVLRDYFEPAPWDYWVILGWREFLDNGVFGHDMFVLMGGTYYGGPSYYNPKGLDISQLPQ